MLRAVIICVSIFIVHSGLAQQFAGEEAWKEIFVHQGVRFLYIFYPKADALNDGVVVMLQNQNDYHVHYRFTIVFESPEGTETEDASGIMGPKETKTGDSDGLFWIPFDDQRSLGAIRMRKYKVTQVESPTPSTNCDSVCI
ncbi:MAG: hypothetical protein OXE59_11365 [Bacteroidetes bacterium]|nr:hypothetical protein [Bacteroidota bacterium]MCY4234322.1 hypothetical protein [Bacteroidota bacterium]